MFNNPLLKFLLTKRILPILSNPNKVDSDDDGFLDNAYMDKANKIPYEWVKGTDEYFNISDPHPLKKEIIWQWPAQYSDGTTIDRLQSAFREIRTDKYDNVVDIHNGIDITPLSDNRVNCAVVAAYDGEVISKIENHSAAGYYIEIKHTINGKIYISRYLHLEKFDGNTPKVGDHVKAGDKIGFISGTPYGDWKEITNEDGEAEKVFIVNAGGLNRLYGKHLHYTLSMDVYNNPIDPLCFDVDHSNKPINDSEIMFMKFSKGLKPTCDSKCKSCMGYFKKVAEMYRLDDTNWGV